ncbi:hypothetical protein ES703_28962 [subsurface metagenome]|jgi:hypothetical protein
MKIIVPHPMITIGTAAWGKTERELYKASQEAIRFAVQSHPQKEDLQKWLENRMRLSITVEFHLKSQRLQSDLDNLFSDLLNPLVEGACGPRPAGKPIPQTKDALFWKATLLKVKDDFEQTFIKIEPLPML